MSRYLDTIPHPWTRAIIQTALFKSHSETSAAIEDTVGGKLWRSLHDLQETVGIVEYSTTELLDEICLFGEHSKNATFWHKADTSEAETHTRTVKRKLFNCTSSIMALVDHARKFQKSTPVVGYPEKIQSVFSPPGRHDFLQCLRNYNTHWRIAQSHWAIKYDFKLGTRDAVFAITKSELLLWGGWTAKAKEYISTLVDEVNIYDIFSEYRKNVQNFYAWHKGAIIDEHAEILRPYLEYKRIYEGIQKKYYWNAMISHAPKSASLFQYIGQYLPKRQFELLLTYEHRSESQVDALIKMLEMDDFCDEPLRQKVLALFKPPK